MSVAHLPIVLNVCVELNVSSPDEEKQPCTVGELSVGAADGCSTPVVAVAVDAVAADTARVAADTARVAANKATIADVIVVFIVESGSQDVIELSSFKLSSIRVPSLV
jgi:hypothetical protein